jgi:maltose/moltooligosaccharide transporter
VLFQIQLLLLPGWNVFIVLWTVITSKEYSPESWKLLKTQRNHFHKEEFSADWYITNGHSHLTKGILFLIVSVLFSIYHYDLKKDLYVLSLGLIGLGGISDVSFRHNANNTTDNGFVTIMNDFQFMPTIMKQLAWVNFFPGLRFSLYGFTGLLKRRTKTIQRHH